MLWLLFLFTTKYFSMCNTFCQYWTSTFNSQLQIRSRAWLWIKLILIRSHVYLLSHHLYNLWFYCVCMSTSSHTIRKTQSTFVNRLSRYNFIDECNLISVYTTSGQASKQINKQTYYRVEFKIAQVKYHKYCFTFLTIIELMTSSTDCWLIFGYIHPYRSTHIARNHSTKPFVHLLLQIHMADIK